VIDLPQKESLADYLFNPPKSDEEGGKSE
jgi:hypothetical protein